MKPSQDPTPDEQNFEQSLAAVERSLDALKARYAQVQHDQQEQGELQQQLRYSQDQLKYNPSMALQADIKQIKQRLEELEIALESQLFSWQGLREVFWLAVRFGGIGIILGWMLKSCAG